MRRVVILCIAIGSVIGLKAQQPPPILGPLPTFTPVRPIAPPATPLPAEAASANVTRFAFLDYGDTRCDCALPDYDRRRYAPAKPEVETAHGAVVDAMIRKVKALAGGPSPVRFVVQSGDATWRGFDGERWNVFIPIVERITRGANLPFFYVPGNHDVTAVGADEPEHTIGMHNALSAFSKLNPAEGSPRRLNGYATFAVGYGNLFLIGIDSNIPGDVTQLAWVSDQLDHLDRARYHHIVAVMHHPAFTSGRYSGAQTSTTLPNGQSAAGGVSPQALVIRGLYMPLFRKHHVQLILAGHDHLFDHWVERYTRDGKEYRIDQIISAGGGAPTYVYTGEPDLREYQTLAAVDRVRVEHLARPGPKTTDNPHHFLVVYVDGDKLSVEVVPSSGTFTPYTGKSRVDLQP